jgi:putative DNA methylase
MKKKLMRDGNRVGSGSTLIESDRFPFELLSSLAERESWRKEVHRPIYHLHKWWAKRLGSVFRGILLGCLLPETSDLRADFYQNHGQRNVSVLDPFMGSGTTIGEAHKLGCIALGRDINPVACESVRVALGPIDRAELVGKFSELAADVGERIRGLYASKNAIGQQCEVLYYFWVKNLPCPDCGDSVDLFSSRIIARDAYPDRKPEVGVCCPNCGFLFRTANGKDHTTCPNCKSDFDPDHGPAKGSKATCPSCSRMFSIGDAVRRSSVPPSHRLYGKLLLTPEGKKEYAAATTEDVDAYQACSVLLQDELEQGHIRLPDATLTDGYNTRQAMSYNYLAWRDFFNDRQLLALGWLHASIASLCDSTTRDALLLLFSGVLEFNNVFASYKGEGTGAVRHMFSHHILKPERVPIEANVWGTPKSSGSFSNLFRTRLLRALDYRDAPFELGYSAPIKRFYCSPQFSGKTETVWPKDGDFKQRSIYLSCGSSQELHLPDQSIDYVVTDPPFFDNVHYSELADFFFAWQKIYPHGFIGDEPTTRNLAEVQDGNADSFSAKLREVLSECRRVLKNEGLLVFTYHHSRSDGWMSLAAALFGAGFSVVNAHPVKSELSVAAPKAQAKEPIQLDVVLVCKKRENDSRQPDKPHDALTKAIASSRDKIQRLTSSGLKLSRNDCRVVALSQFICALGPVPAVDDSVGILLTHGGPLDEMIADVHQSDSATSSKPETEERRTSRLRPPMFPAGRLQPTT